MTDAITQNNQIIQMMQIMNQLHRMSSEGDFETCTGSMSVSQLACISFLAYQKGRPVYQRDLENCFKLRRSTISSLLTTLEKKGLLQRVPVPHDARLKGLVLTKAGNEMGNRVMDRFADLNSILVADLCAEERQTLHRILDKMERGLASRCP